MTDDKDDIALDRLFQAARQQASMPDADFMARLAVDADGLMPAPAPVAPQRPARSAWQRFEGWASFAALASTAATGVWIGVALPETTELPGASYFGVSTDVSALIPDYGSAFLEEE